jgi:hypothetical protein
VNQHQLIILKLDEIPMTLVYLVSDRLNSGNMLLVLASLYSMSSVFEYFIDLFQAQIRLNH